MLLCDCVIFYSQSNAFSIISKNTITTQLLDDDSVRSPSLSQSRSLRESTKIIDVLSLRQSNLSLRGGLSTSRSIASVRYTEKVSVKEEKDDLFCLEESKRATLRFNRVKYTLDTSNKVLLQNVCGMVVPGEMLSIMGSSGAGKTTLLSVLCGKANSGIVEGDILLNDRPLLSSISSQSDRPSFAYVMQSDAHIPSLTVRETLMFAAMLRLKEYSTRSTAVVSAVDWVLELLSLQQVRTVASLLSIVTTFICVYISDPDVCISLVMKVGSNIIGHGDHMNISVGQLRRLTIGVELVNKPSLIFLDEPTSGLDSYLASTVVTGLKNLAVQGHTIVCTIHQPSCDIFYGFSKLLLMSSGMPVYFGDTQTCITYFVERIHCQVPSSSVNPAEFVVDIAAAAAAAAAATTNGSDSDHPTTVQLSEMLFNTWDPADKELIHAPHDTVRNYLLLLYKLT